MILQCNFTYYVFLIFFHTSGQVENGKRSKMLQVEEEGFTGGGFRIKRRPDQRLKNNLYRSPTAGFTVEVAGNVLKSHLNISKIAKEQNG